MAMQSPYEPAPGRPARWKRRVYALSLGLVLTMIAGEVLVRLLDVPPLPLEPLYVPSYQLSEDPELLYEYRPNYRGEGGGYDGAHRTLHTNSHGFRDREVAAKKPPGTLRVLALGDSTTAGVGVARTEDVYPKVLERLLAERVPEPRIEVLNMGVGGYYTLQEVRALELKGLAFEPDFVMVLFCVNDFWSGADGDVKMRLEAAQVHVGPSGVPRASLLGLLLQRSRLAFCLYHRVRNYIDVHQKTNWDRDDRLVEDGLRRLKTLQEEHGFRAIVFILPSFEEPWERYPRMGEHDRLREIATRVGDIEVVDLLPEFERLAPDSAPIRVDDLHPNEAGHALLAEILEGHLRERWLAQRTGEPRGARR